MAGNTGETETRLALGIPQHAGTESTERHTDGWGQWECRVSRDIKAGSSFTAGHLGPEASRSLPVVTPTGSARTRWSHSSAVAQIGGSAGPRWR